MTGSRQRNNIGLRGVTLGASIASACFGCQMTSTLLEPPALPRYACRHICGSQFALPCGRCQIQQPSAGDALRDRTPLPSVASRIPDHCVDLRNRLGAGAWIAGHSPQAIFTIQHLVLYLPQRVATYAGGCNHNLGANWKVLHRRQTKGC